MAAILEEKDTNVARYEALAASLGDGQPPAVRALRAEALARFAELGFPSTRHEQWRYTSVASIAKTPFGLAPEATADLGAYAHVRIDDAAVQMVFVNGRFVRDLSTAKPVDGVTFAPLAESLTHPSVVAHLGRVADASKRHFAALNTALLNDGAFVEVAPGTRLEAPIHLLFISTAGPAPHIANVRNLIVAGRNSEVRVVETYAGEQGASYFTNSVTELVLGENSNVDHSKVQRESEAAYHVGSLHVSQARTSQLASHSISLGGAIVRSDIDTILDGEGAGCVLNGLYLVRGQQHVDHHTLIDHAKPHCDSQEFYKGILDDKSRGVFDGRIVVRKDAQKTNSGQVNKNLLLSADAIVDAKPQLEIFADDVKCTHGSTIGQLDEKAIFYLRSRAIGLDDARNLLTFAFASEVVERLKVPAIRTQLEAVLLERLGAGGSR